MGTGVPAGTIGCLAKGLIIPWHNLRLSISVLGTLTIWYPVILLVRLAGRVILNSIPRLNPIVTGPTEADNSVPAVLNGK